MQFQASRPGRTGAFKSYLVYNFYATRHTGNIVSGEYRRPALFFFFCSFRDIVFVFRTVYRDCLFSFMHSFIQQRCMECLLRVQHWQCWPYGEDPDGAHSIVGETGLETIREFQMYSFLQTEWTRECDPEKLGSGGEAP